MIETERLILRCPKNADTNELTELWRNPKVREYLGGVLNDKEIEEKIILLHEHWSLHNFGFWVVLEKSSQQIIGLCGLSYEEGGLELSYMFFPQYWGQGFAREAAKEVLKYGFRIADVNEIICVTQNDNTRSHRLLESIGMEHVKDFQKFNSMQSLFSINISSTDTEMEK